MPYLLEDLIIDRVDLVDEGANSAAFIQIYKRRERKNMDITEIVSKMKPEHAEVIQKTLDESAESLATVTSELEVAKATVETLTEDLQKSADELEVLKAAALTAEEEEKAKKAAAAFDEEEVIKALPEAARELLAKERTKREAAEDQIRKAKEAEEHATAVAKAATLKALPIEQDKLVDILKTADDSVVALLTTVSAAIESTVLVEVGKSTTSAGANTDGWAKIEAEADKMVAADSSITKQKAIATVIKEKPELYKEYLQGGVN